MCGWESRNSGEGSFIRFQPNTKWQGGNHPLKDTTIKTEFGHYALFSIFGNHARPQTFVSPMIKSKSSTVCISFYYFVETGRFQENAIQFSIKSLTVKTNFKTIYLNSTKLEWTKFEKTFKKIPKFYSLEFSLMLNIMYLSDVGFDDFEITDGHCHGDTKPR